MSDDPKVPRRRSMSRHALHRLGGGRRDQRDELSALHSKSSRGKAWLLASQRCGCFYCLKEFSADQINQWVDDAQTALCPYCEIDSVIAVDAQSANHELLEAMHIRWFKTGGLTADQW